MSASHPAFPETGGEYTILSRALGPAWGVAVLSLNLLGFSVAQALSGVGVATYLAAVWPGLPVRPTAVVLVVLVTVTAVLNIRVNAAMTGAFLAVELVALLLLTVLGFAHVHRGPVAALMRPEVVSATGLASPSLALLGAATVGAIYAYNGYGAVVFLGEELHEAPRRIARVVFLSLGIAVITELAPIAAVLVGVADLRTLTAAASPIPMAINRLGGPAVARAMSPGGRAGDLQRHDRGGADGGASALQHRAGRPLARALQPRLGACPPTLRFTLDRDADHGRCGAHGLFPGPAHPRFDPWNGNVAIYAGLCLAALIGRRSGATTHMKYRMPLFPIPPVFALAFLAGVVGFDFVDPAGRRGLAATAVTIAMALVYYAMVHRKRRS